MRNSPVFCNILSKESNCHYTLLQAFDAYQIKLLHKYIKLFTQIQTVEIISNCPNRNNQLIHSQFYHNEFYMLYQQIKLYYLYQTARTISHHLPLQWRHNEHDSVSNHQPHDCLLNRLFGRRSKKTSKLRVTDLCMENYRGPVNSPHKWPVTRKMFPFDDVIMHNYELSLPAFVLL